ncbi:putative Shikimate O-hydroxycinnamoyltransferase [Cocos nucifera]|uniref:Putative Shikimate O-hydroxycinnamoyltransferase n=1 Tax=Cocos nucifera TaxID=13894 RepID=A0A8K0HUF9_COCNU|nr:putative Shikimate O-hydroxycinnamoyltransferase [Cocos nucifera]
MGMAEKEMGGMVEVVESGFVVPSEETPKQQIWLSNLDLWFGRHYTATVYVYVPDGDPNFFSVEALKAALGKALVSFYPMAGRLVVNRDGRLEIECTGEGVPFVVARSNFTLGDFGDFTPPTDVRPLLVPPAESVEPPCILIMFQVSFESPLTRFLYGYVMMMPGILLLLYGHRNCMLPTNARNIRNAMAPKK